MYSSFEEEFVGFELMLWFMLYRKMEDDPFSEAELFYSQNPQQDRPKSPEHDSQKEHLRQQLRNGEAFDLSDYPNEQ